jgi:hypothetical protein
VTASTTTRRDGELERPGHLGGDLGWSRESGGARQLRVQSCKKPASCMECLGHGRARHRGVQRPLIQRVGVAHRSVHRATRPRRGGQSSMNSWEVRSARASMRMRGGNAQSARPGPGTNKSH